jgi:hypothetical protein
MSRSRTRKRKRQIRGWRVAAMGAGALLLASLGGWAASKGIAAGAKGKTADTAPVDAAPDPAAKPDTVRILIQTVPPRRARVRWGAKSLGTIPAPRPLVVVRPRDSGPLDLVIRAAGYLPVHTRAYTFVDSRVAVKLTALAEKNKLFGYREELPPPSIDGGVPDARVPSATGPTPSTPTPPPAPPAR